MSDAFNIGSDTATERVWERLNTDQRLCEMVSEAETAARIAAPGDVHVRDGMWTREQGVRELFREKLRAIVTREATDGDEIPFGRVDWADLAERWLERS